MFCVTHTSFSANEIPHAHLLMQQFVAEMGREVFCVTHTSLSGLHFPFSLFLKPRDEFSKKCPHLEEGWTVDWHNPNL